MPKDNDIRHGDSGYGVRPVLRQPAQATGY